MIPEYLFLVYRYMFKTGYFANLSTQTTNIANLSNKLLDSLVFPIPPLEEQHRIQQNSMNFLALLSNSKTPFLQRNPLTSDSEKQMPGGHHYRAFVYSRHSLFAENSALQAAEQNKLP